MKNMVATMARLLNMAVDLAMQVAMVKGFNKYLLYELGGFR